MEKEKSTSYVIFDFMVEDLGLRGVALKVYALIYSFTKAGGSCYGSLNYICERTGASRAAVKRATKKLLDCGYIFKTENRSVKTNSYKARMEIVAQNELIKKQEWAQNEPILKQRWAQNEPEMSSKRAPNGLKMNPNNKDNNKEITTTTNIHSFKGEESLRDPFLSADADKADKTAELAKALDVDGGYISMTSIMPDPPPMRFFGQRRVVMMTLHQYVCLLRNLGIHTALHYIRNLEKCIISRPEAHYKNHYKTILKWAEEDARAE